MRTAQLLLFLCNMQCTVQCRGVLTIECKIQCSVQCVVQFIVKFAKNKRTRGTQDLFLIRKTNHFLVPVQFKARCTFTLQYTVQCKKSFSIQCRVECPINICRVLYSYVSSNLCTRGKRKLFFRDQARLDNNFCGFVKLSVTNSVQYCVQCSLNLFWRIILFSVENTVMHSVQQTKGGIPLAIRQLSQLSSASSFDVWVHGIVNNSLKHSLKQGVHYSIKCGVQCS